MVYYKFGRCTVCQSRLSIENVFTLKECNHTFHHECVTRWISEGSQDCPRCRVPATLNDIKQLFVETGTSSEDSGDELTQSTSNETTKDSTKIQKTNSDHNNEIREIEQKCKELIEEKFKRLKAENKQKDEKIISLEKFGDLAIKLSNVIFKDVNFIPTRNKWSDTGGRCCDKYCCNSNNPVCVEGNAFFNIKDQNVNYVAGKYSKGVIFVYAENLFKNPQDYFNYSLYYFEVKCKFEGEYSEFVDWIYFGLGGRRNLSSDKHIWYSAKNATITNEKYKSFKISTSFNNNDIFGCGIVYPPTNMLNEFPYVFFTQNGKQIGKGILIKDNFVSYPFVRLKDYFGHEFMQAISLKENFDTSQPVEWLRFCSVEANFGNNLELKPFCYDITKQFVLKEFYEDSDVD